MPEQKQQGAGYRVLVVDDEAAVLSVLTMALKKRGYEVATATSASAALDALNRETFDIIIADIIMPDRDGFEFLAEVRKRPDSATIPFIFLTGDRTVRSKVKGLESGVDEYLTKPCSMDELYARMDAIMRRRAEARARVAAHGTPTADWDLTGSLAIMPPHEMIQMLHMNRKTGLLRLKTRFGKGEIFFDNGAVVHAALEGIDGKEAVFLLFAVDGGTFDFREGVRATVKTVTEYTPGLLLEGMRQMDETRAILKARDRVKGQTTAGEQD